MTQLTGESLLVGNSGNFLECGDIITYDFGNHPDPTLLRAGREEAFERPAIVITTSNFNKKTGFAWVSPITSVDKSDKSFISQISLPNNLRTYGFVLPDQLTFVECSSSRIIDVREKAPLFVQQIIPTFSRQIPKLNGINKNFPLSIQDGLVSKFYKPDYGHVVTYDIFPVDSHRHSPPLAVVITPLAFSRRTKLAWVCPVVKDPAGYIYEVPLPTTCPYQGVILLDQLQTLDWDTRKFKPVYQLPFEITKGILYRISEIISSS